MNKIIYADHSATTYVKKEVLDEMLPYFTDKFGNGSSVYSLGVESKKAICNAREKVANALNCNEKEIYFTASGSESDNLALLGIARANSIKGKHIITSKIEHLAILETCKRLEKEGFEVTYLDVNSKGLIEIENLKKYIRKDTILISIMFANNEIGTLEPIEEIGKLAKENNIIFHTDAVQAIGNIHIDVKSMNIDALSLSGHKFYGPKGVGALYIKEDISFLPIIYGGHQEKSKRAGTENLAGIVGLGKAIELANDNIDKYNLKLFTLREYALKRIINEIPGVKLNGDRDKRLPGNLNISIFGIDGLSLLLMLDMEGIYISIGSACTSSSVNPSHVLTAIGLNESQAKSSLRFTFGDENTKEDIDYIIYKLKTLVFNLRNKI
ncbi:MAG: cysteine desulfurase NifS [Clostridia bacterium]